MKTLNTDKAWIKHGKNNPYYGVLAHDEFMDENLTAESKAKFFDSGDEYVGGIFHLLETEFQLDYQPEKSLDFGCGTGRLTLPIAARSQHVTGVDISESMLRETQKNAEEREVANLSLVTTADFLDSISTEEYDFIHSYIVFQHINVERGKVIFEKLYHALKVGGIGVIQLTYSNSKSRLERAINVFRYRVPFFNNFLNVVRGKPFGLPLMQMNLYDLNEIFGFLHQNGVGKVQVKFSDHGGHYGVVLFFQKEKETANT